MLSLWIVGLSFALTSTAFAALPFSPTAVNNLKVRSKKGACYDVKTNKLTHDICQAYGLKPKAKTSKWGVRQSSPSQIILEKSGHIIKIERTDSAREFIINAARIDFGQTKNHEDIKSLIQNSVRNKSGRLSLFLEIAFAAQPDAEVSSLVQQLVAETHQLDNCGFYVDFGQKCVEGMKKFMSEVEKRKLESSNVAEASNGIDPIRRRANHLTAVHSLNAELQQLSDRLEGAVFPSLKGYDTVRNCAAQKSPNNINKVQADAEASLMACREEVKKMMKVTGGAREVKRSEGLVGRMWNRIMGNAPANDSGTGGADGGGGAAEGRE
jgi:hypothetical protein